MDILTYGYKLPETGDRGAIFFPAIEDDINRLNDHNHDGLNSSQLTAQSVVAISQSLLAAGWVAVVAEPGLYRQLVTMIPGTLFDSYSFAFQVVGGGDDGKRLQLRHEKVAPTTFYVYINDNTAALTVLYLV